MAELEEKEVDRESPFHPDNVAQYTLLTLLQCRDLLAGILQGVNQAGYNQIRASHRAGALVLDPPRLVPQGEDGNADAAN